MGEVRIPLEAIKGRGTATRFPHRFERDQRQAFDDGWTTLDERVGEDHEPLRTEVIWEDAKSIIASNESPDVYFDRSINPYRGCEHGCIYCLDGATAVLMADGSTKPLGDLGVGDEIMGTRKEGHCRKYVRTSVLAHWKTQKPAYQIQLADGTSLTASGDHRFLTERGWKFVANAGGGEQRPHLTLGNSLMGIGAMAGKYDFEGQSVKSRADLQVVSIEPLAGKRELFDITTGTEDFIAEGVISHNCYARPTHSYLNMSPGLDFETKIIAKRNIAAVLRHELSKKHYEPKLIAIGTATDCYQPLERELRLTRSVIELMHETNHAFGLVTKSSGVERDLDLIAPMAAKGLACINVTITTLDSELTRKLEPRAAAPHRRLRTLKTLAENGIPCGVSLAPQIPFLTDDMEQVLEAAWDAGARSAFYHVLRLPWEVSPLFRQWLEMHYPQRAARIMARIYDMRGGKDYDSDFATRMKGTGIWADLIAKRFHRAAEKIGFNRERVVLDTTQFRRPGLEGQATLF